MNDDASLASSVEAGDPTTPPRPVGRGAVGPLPRLVRHLVARRQQAAAARADRRAAAVRSAALYRTRSVDA